MQFAKCMREHGIDMPDPTISNDGGGVMVQIGGAPGSGNDKGPDPKEVDAANKACEHFLKDAGGRIRSSERGGPEEDAGAGAGVQQVHA